MDRKISARISGNDNEVGKTKAMFVVDAFGPEEAAMSARRMIEKESRGAGDQMNAMERVAARCGLSARQLRRFMAGDRKEPGWRLIHGIRVGWFSFLEEEFRKVQHDLAIAKRKYGGDHFEDFDTEVQALDQKIQAAKLRAEEERIR